MCDFVRIVMVTLESVDCQFTIVDSGDVVILQENHLIRVLDNGRRVGCEEILDVLVADGSDAGESVIILI